MQYILTEQEYKALTPINKVNELEENVRLLNDKVMELTEHPCGRQIRVQKNNNILNNLQNKSEMKKIAIYKHKSDIERIKEKD